MGFLVIVPQRRASGVRVWRRPVRSGSGPGCRGWRDQKRPLWGVLPNNGTEDERRPRGSPDARPWLLWLPSLSITTTIVRSQGRYRNAFDTGAEYVAVHGPVEDPGRIDPVVAESGDERGAVPMPEGRSPGPAFAFGRPYPQRGHVGLHPCLIDEDQPCRVDPFPIAFPPLRASFHIRACTFVDDRCPFLKLGPQRRRNRQTVSWLTAMPRSASFSCSMASVTCGQARTCSGSHVRCGSSIGRRYPPIPAGLTEPVCAARCVHRPWHTRHNSRRISPFGERGTAASFRFVQQRL